MPKLSETQTVLLSAAAARPDRSICPAPEGLKVKGAAFARTLKALLRQGFIAQTGVGLKRARIGAVTEQTEHLIITSTGLAALGIEPNTASDSTPTEETAPDVAAAVKPGGTRPDGKMGLMLDMVSNANGATIDELATQAGWLPHTTRSALTRLRQRGFDIQLAAVGDRRAYRLGSTG